MPSRSGPEFNVADKGDNSCPACPACQVRVFKPGQKPAETTNIMEPFVHLPEYRIVVCKICQYACVSNEVNTHLRKKHESIPLQERKDICSAVSTIPGVIQDQAGLADFPFPTTIIQPVPFITPPIYNGFRCEICGYVICTIRGIQEHCRVTHGWENSRKAGRIASIISKEPQEVPWTAGVPCQRFFPTRAGRRWFEVSNGTTPTAGPADPTDGWEQRIRRIHEEQAEKMRNATHGTITEATQTSELNPWVERTGWAKHLKGLDPDRLFQTTAPITGDEATLAIMWATAEQVMDQARAIATADKVGRQALFEIERKDADKKPNRPFDNRLEDDTWARYKDVFRVMLCIWFRTADWDEKDHPPYQMSKKQGDLYDSFNGAAQAIADQGGPVDIDDRIRGQFLNMMMAFFSEPYKTTEYENIVISALAVMGIREDGGWVTAMNYTPIYSAVVKVTRMLVLYKSWLEREEEVARLKRVTGNEEYALNRADSVFVIVRRKVQQFMTRTGGDPAEQPKVMDWIFDTRTYGMHIRFNTAAAGKTDWVGTQITHQRVQFNMSQLSDMLHGLVNDLRMLLAQLTASSTEDTSQLPPISWATMQDDHSEERVNYSFLEDDRNTWVSRGRGWVLNNILAHLERREEWSGRAKGEMPYAPGAVRQYARWFEDFREKMWMAMHMTGGQPARSTEISGIRYRNTANGGIRNIFTHNGMVCFVTSYHKNYRQTAQAKVIHRYLPREVGELLVWYLWLVLPFWQEVQGVIKNTPTTSPFLWSDEVVTRGSRDSHSQGSHSQGSHSQGSHSQGSHSQGSHSQEHMDSQEDINSQESRDGRESMDSQSQESMDEVDSDNENNRRRDIPSHFFTEERKWTSDRARRIIQQNSERLMGVRLNTSAWRHIAIAIANKYLNKSFGQAEGGNDEDEDGVEDNIWDLQAGHGTHVAGMIYARDIQAGALGTAARREQYRAVSQQWHRFLGFTGGDQEGARAGMKRKKEPFEGMRQEARFRRFARLQQVNIRGQLRMMMGGDAAFRGQQEAVIRAITSGESPIVQVEKTGGGKSLSFMLPAFCSPDGTTIVIVPLISLQQDLQGRCARHGITSRIWQSRGNSQTASIVFVTPESAVTKGFGDFVHRLQARQALDRVVVDECHVLPDGQAEFRPQLQMVGPVVREWGVQKVFLTATLAPRDEDEFYRAAAIPRATTKMFRARTTRANIAYRVETVQAGKKGEEAEDRKVRQIVTQWLNQHGEGRAIVYPGTVSRVEALGQALGCEIYHRHVDTVEGKARRLASWIQEGKVMVATNALGLGVDIPDVRLVIHVGSPRRVRDYVQESGRAGRDGQPSEAVIVCQRQPAAREKTSRGAAKQEPGGREEEMVKFTQGTQCRRVILDQVMDGYFERTNCEEGEEACDVCRRRRAEAEFEEELESTLVEEDEDIREGREAEGDKTATEQRFEQSQRQFQFDRWSAQQARIQAGEEAAKFTDQLERWAGCCVVCRVSGARNTYHTAEQCRNSGTRLWQESAQQARRVGEEMFIKKRFAKYSGCFHCGFPQGMCEGWQASDEDGGQFRQTGRECQYKGLLVNIYGVMCAYDVEGADHIFQMVAEEDGSEVGEGDAAFQWLGGRRRWGSWESNRMCRGLYYMIPYLEKR